MTEKKQKSYPKFAKINGTHPFRKAAPGSYVDYGTRRRRGGRVFFFNFELAKEMGLIRKNHPEELNRELTKTILDTFSLQIINEYDIANNTQIPEAEKKEDVVMATRYLQLQHPSRRGYTSGDGRSIWNGYFEGTEAVWDVTSCGTGGTCLSPAAAIEGKHFKTGDKEVSYGCGLADLSDGVCEAIMSEIFYHNRIPTTRMLAVVAYEDGTAVNVRTAKNLMRPAHFFLHLKQGNYECLKGAIDYYIDRQVKNKEWPRVRNVKERYEKMLEHVATSFAKAAATFESEYIFCWMDWDGDNILMDGGIIDYGSIRQFGLYHHRYRYNDVDKMSTTITEQKNMARYIVQTFAQLTDFLLTKKKKNIKKFRDHKILKVFQEAFDQTKKERALYKMGFSKEAYEKMLQSKATMEELQSFRKVCTYFEKVKARRGHYKVSDGITWDAIFCLRDILRELPKLYLKGHVTIPPKQFIDILKSNYASRKDLTLKRSRKEKVYEFQRLYWKLLERVANFEQKEVQEILGDVIEKSELINRHARVTGDSILFIAKKMMRGEKELDSKALYKIYKSFIREQILIPEYFDQLKSKEVIRNKNSQKILHSMFKAVEECREGI